MTTKQELKEKILSNIVVDSNGCYIQQKNIQYDGYAKFPLEYINEDTRKFLSSLQIVNKYGIQTHKLTHLLFNGPLTKEKPLVLHTCGNKACVNPTHLYAGNHQDNVDDMILSGKRAIKHKTKTEEHQEEIRMRIRAGQSYFSIAKRYGMYISQVMCYANTMKRNGESFATSG